MKEDKLNHYLTKNIPSAESFEEFSNKPYFQVLNQDLMNCIEMDDLDSSMRLASDGEFPAKF